MRGSDDVVGVPGAVGGDRRHQPEQGDQHTDDDHDASESGPGGRQQPAGVDGDQRHDRESCHQARVDLRAGRTRFQIASPNAAASRISSTCTGVAGNPSSGPRSVDTDLGESAGERLREEEERRDQADPARGGAAERGQQHDQAEQHDADELQQRHVLQPRAPAARSPRSPTAMTMPTAMTATETTRCRLPRTARAATTRRSPNRVSGCRDARTDDHHDQSGDDGGDRPRDRVLARTATRGRGRAAGTGRARR